MKAKPLHSSPRSGDPVPFLPPRAPRARRRVPAFGMGMVPFPLSRGARFTFAPGPAASDARDALGCVS